MSEVKVYEWRWMRLRKGGGESHVSAPGTCEQRQGTLCSCSPHAPHGARWTSKWRLQTVFDVFGRISLLGAADVAVDKGRRSWKRVYVLVGMKVGYGKGGR